MVSLSNFMVGMAEISTVWAAGAVVAIGAGVPVGEAFAPAVGEAAGRVGLAAAAGRVDVAVAFSSSPPPQATATRARVEMARNVNARSLLLRISNLLYSNSPRLWGHILYEYDTTAVFL
jgi:hypothetical protein